MADAPASVTLRLAGAADAPALTAIALAAKSHWGYPVSWIERWRDSLTIDDSTLARFHTIVAELEGEPVGFCAIEVSGTDATLEHLWVLPRAMGSGAGRALFTAAERYAISLGATRLEVESDPHAEAFYAHMGARRVGGNQADMDGVVRVLPVMEKTLAACVSS